MAANYTQMIAHVEKSQRELELAVMEFPTNDRVTLATAYILGHLRACLAAGASAIEFIKETQAKEQPPKAPNPQATKT